MKAGATGYIIDDTNDVRVINKVIFVGFYEDHGGYEKVIYVDKAHVDVEDPQLKSEDKDVFYISLEAAVNAMKQTERQMLLGKVKKYQKMILELYAQLNGED